MILLVDVGNTRVKWRVLNESFESALSGVVLNSELTGQYIYKNFNELYITSVYVSNVAADSILPLFGGFASSKNADLRVMKSKGSILGVSFKYEDINKLGVDRSLALVGAYDGEAVLVIDAGSAITADYLSENGEYLGGYIMPGLEMNRNLLIKKTAKVGVSADIGSDLPGLSTNECVNNGVVVMFRSLMSGLIDVAEARGVARFVVTGGDAELFQAWCSGKLECHENLVLDGLAKVCLSERQFSRELQR